METEETKGEGVMRSAAPEDEETQRFVPYI